MPIWLRSGDHPLVAAGRWWPNERIGLNLLSRGRAPACPTCQQPMRKSTASSGNLVGIVLALVVFVVGLGVTILIPLLGWIVGPLLMLLALGMGGKRSKVWRCKPCVVVLARG